MSVGSSGGHGRPPVKTGAVVLCAGRGSRFRAAEGEYKLLATFRGRPLVSWALEHAAQASLDLTMAVTGPVDLAAAMPEGVIALHNPDWEHGIATSLQSAVAAAP